LGAFGDLEAEEFLDGEGITEIIGEWIEVIDSVCKRNNLLIELSFAGFLNAGVEITDLGPDAGDDLAVDFNHESQHAVCSGVLRTHVEDHTPRVGSVGDGELEDRRAGVFAHQR
jgi:hypothetical protein